jgi:hypothetical protein
MNFDLEKFQSLFKQENDDLIKDLVDVLSFIIKQEITKLSIDYTNPTIISQLTYDEVKMNGQEGLDKIITLSYKTDRLKISLPDKYMPLTNRVNAVGLNLSKRLNEKLSKLHDNISYYITFDVLLPTVSDGLQFHYILKAVTQIKIPLGA